MVLVEAVTSEYCHTTLSEVTYLGEAQKRHNKRKSWTTASNRMHMHGLLFYGLTEVKNTRNKCFRVFWGGLFQRFGNGPTSCVSRREQGQQRGSGEKRGWYGQKKKRFKGWQRECLLSASYCMGAFLKADFTREKALSPQAGEENALSTLGGHPLPWLNYKDNFIKKIRVAVGNAVKSILRVKLLLLRGWGKTELE